VLRVQVSVPPRISASERRKVLLSIISLPQYVFRVADYRRLQHCPDNSQASLSRAGDEDQIRLSQAGTVAGAGFGLLLPL
jgi:hypothetical protein